MEPGQEKTVYVLGAGFSAGAGLRMQNQVLKGLLDRISYYSPGIIPEQGEEHFCRELDNDIRTVTTFIDRCFPNSNQTLEDIFTLLDQTISLRAHFFGYDHLELARVRSRWLSLIYGFFHLNLAGYLRSNDTLYQQFAAHLLHVRSENGLNSDPVSVISLNWDSLLEEAAYQVLLKTGGIRKADIDHCVYTTPLDDSPHTPSPKQKASGIFNLKVLKIHGSINWLRCPNSNHLYTGLGASGNAYELYLRPRRSPFIAERYPDGEENDPSNAPLLEPFIITPTYAKVFDQPHIQTTWHNAYVELREATRVVFIGYSLPEADYHFRTLLRRAIRKRTRIEVYLYQDDNAPEALERDSYEAYIRNNLSFATERYGRLFGEENIQFDYKGVNTFIENCLPQDKFPSTLASLEERFRGGR
jgi:NAD-dependent SIR2 family protein deacetylase